MEVVTLSLPRETCEVIADIARTEDVTMGHVVRSAIARDLRRRMRARRSERTDEALVARLRARLADDLAFSRTWAELQARLGRRGYALWSRGGGLILASLPDGVRVCKASELGYPRARLEARLGPMKEGRRAA